jgi:arabinofuranan 3-O-arabinosyltransferase
LTVRDWLGDRREVTVGSGAATYLTTYENYNDGWKATLDGKELTPVRLDGWQQGWRIPSGSGGTVKLTYEPATTYEGGLIGGAAGLAVLIGLVVWRRRAPNPDPVQPPAPLPGLWLGTVVLTAVGIVIAGWFALLVPALALLALRRRPLLVPIAFAALAGAGIAAATGAGEPAGAGHGAFGHAAQLLALIGLFAGVVSVREPDERPGSTAVLPAASSPGSAPGGPAPGSEAPTRPLPPLPHLPQRQRGESGPPPGRSREGERGDDGGPRSGPADATPAPGPDAGHTISARGPGGPDPDPPTARIRRGKPLFRPTAPETERPEKEPPETDRERGEPT